MSALEERSWLPVMSLFCVDGVEVGVGCAFKQVMNFNQRVDGRKTQRYLLRDSVDELVARVGADFDVFRQEVREDLDPYPPEEGFLVKFREPGLPSIRVLWSEHSWVWEGRLFRMGKFSVGKRGGLGRAESQATFLKPPKDQSSTDPGYSEGICESF